MKRMTRDRICRSFGADQEPAIVVQLDETFVMETTDRFRGVTESEFPSGDDSLVDTMNGPACIEGAKAGDTIKIEILDITAAAKEAYVFAIPGLGPLTQDISEYHIETVNVEGDSAVFPNGISVPFRPMLGRIGIAPKEGSAPVDAMGPFGGQLSNADVTVGSSLYLPVFHDGAFLSIGDSHMAMGDGESTSSAVEGAVDATLKVSLSKEIQVADPLVMNATDVITCGMGETMEEASDIAVKAMADLLTERLKIDRIQAAMLIGCAADVRACLTLHPPYRMKVVMPRSVAGI